MNKTNDGMRPLANMRDMGGAIGFDGRPVRRGALIRSDEPVGLTGRERAMLADMGLRRIIDLRDDGEAEKRPLDCLQGVKYVRVNIMGEADEYAPSLTNMTRFDDAGAMREHMIKLYEIFVEAPAVRRRFREFMLEIMEDAGGATMFNCFAGKDRTGLAAAIIYAMLGVSRDDIVADYLKTNEMSAEKNRLLSAMMEREGKSPEFIAALGDGMAARPEYIAQAFSAADRLYGSFEGYIREGLSLGDAEFARMRELYLG